MFKKSYSLADEDATRKFAARFASILQARLVIYLYGELGAGKTTLVRSILHALGYQGRVKSPTYTLIESYSLSKFSVHHFDLYRFNSIDEWEDSGFCELFTANSICFIEWPDKAKERLPSPDISIQLEFDKLDARNLSILAHSDFGVTCLNQLITQLGAD